MRAAKDAPFKSVFGNASTSSGPEFQQAHHAMEDHEVSVDSYAENAIEPDKPGKLRNRHPSMNPPNSSHPARRSLRKGLLLADPAASGR
jgi:hypothetical protein